MNRVSFSITSTQQDAFTRRTLAAVVLYFEYSFYFLTVLSVCETSVRNEARFRQQCVSSLCDLHMHWINNNTTQQRCTTVPPSIR